MKSMQFSPKIDPLPGSVHPEYTRCNRPGCCCGRGTRHGPFYRRHWMEGGVKRSVYVRLDDVPAVAAACARYRGLHPSRRAFQRMVARFSALADAVLDGLEDQQWR